MQLLNKILLFVEGPIWNFIKKYWKVIVIVIVALILFFTIRKNKELKQELESTTKAHEFEKQKLDNTVKYWKDEFGEEHARFEKSEALNTAQSRYVDSIAQLLKIKKGQINSIAVIDTKTEGGGKLQIDTIWIDGTVPWEQTNEVKIYPFKFSDSWTVIGGEISQGGSTIRYSTVDTISIVDYYDRKRILGMKIGKQTGYVDVTNSNPHSTIRGAKKISLNPPVKHWGLGVSANLGYPIQNFDWKKPVFTIGISVQRTLIRF